MFPPLCLLLNFNVFLPKPTLGRVAHFFQVVLQQGRLFPSLAGGNGARGYLCGRGLASSEPRGALFEKGPDALLKVPGFPDPSVGQGRQAEAILEAHPRQGQEKLLGEAQGGGGVLG